MSGGPNLKSVSALGGSGVLLGFKTLPRRLLDIPQTLLGRQVGAKLKAKTPPGVPWEAS